MLNYWWGVDASAHSDCGGDVRCKGLLRESACAERVASGHVRLRCWTSLSLIVRKWHPSADDRDASDHACGRDGGDADGRVSGVLVVAFRRLVHCRYSMHCWIRIRFC